MHRLHPQVTMHIISIRMRNQSSNNNDNSVQRLRRQSNRKLKKLINSNFVKEEQHPDWVANIVFVPKKNEKIRICIDFCNLNSACPKDEFPLSIIDVMIDNTCEFERMSFMNRFFVYNQIKIYSENEKHTSFRTPLGMIIIPQWLKHSGPTYKQAMNAIFHEHIYKIIGC